MSQVTIILGTNLNMSTNFTVLVKEPFGAVKAVFKTDSLSELHKTMNKLEISSKELEKGLDLAMENDDDQVYFGISGHFLFSETKGEDGASH